MRYALTTLLLLVLLPTVAQASRAPSSPCLRFRIGTETRKLCDYGRQLTLARFHSEAEFRAMDDIIRPESGWNPCAYYPSRHDCHYAGFNSCGIPQANPCPRRWRGRLWETRYAQVRWALDYMTGRYGSPIGALAWRHQHHWY